MSAWVLLIFMGASMGDISITTAEFNTKEACESAAKEFKQIGTFSFHYRCVPKG